MSTPKHGPQPPKAKAVRSLNLAKSRQKAGKTLEQIAAKTKIGMRFLKAIESEDFGQLPGGIFNTNYLRQYAAEIGYDPDRLLAHYQGKTNPPAEEPPKGKPGREGRGLLSRLFRVPA
jgi:cytoskeletal protein RodZ